MRIVSQNGKFDIPYEITVLSRDKNIVRAYIPTVGKMGTTIAQYSTE